MIWAPAGLYWLSNLTDFLDGFLARKTNRVTRLGESLDIKLDGFGVLIATILIVQYSQVPLWYLLVGLARYLFVIGLWIRDRLGKSSIDLPPSVRRRAFAGIQMGFVGVILLPLFGPPGTFWAATVFGLLFLLGFIVDWFIVSGVLDLETFDRYASVSRKALRTLTIGLRVISAGLLVFLIFQRIAQLGSGLGAVVPGPDWFLWVEVVLFLMLTLGSAGRIAALITLLLMGVYQMSVHLSGPQTLLVITSALLFFLGTGPFSIWKPEEKLIDWRAGESN
jgi:CDP-diacylglycerol--glycerol-3-phosphate 3-phosphatidyltransferase